MRLKVGDWGRLPEDRLARVFMAGVDELPYGGRAFRSGDQLIVERRESDSACVWAPWPVGPTPGGEPRGEWLLGTATLMERDEPYLMEVELARGTVYRVRNQLANWKLLGLESSEPLEEQVAEATRLFCRCATRHDEPEQATEHAAAALAVAADASLALTKLYANQAMEARLAAVDKLPTLMGAHLGSGAPGEAEEQLANGLSLIGMPCSWAEIEASEGRRRWRESDTQAQWAQRNGLRICAGPLLEFADRSIPDWAYLFEGDFEALSGLMVGHVEATVKRYRGYVQLWNVAGRVNRAKALGLGDEQRLQLVARAVRAAREADPKSPVIVSLDQPWGEYLTGEPSELSPIDFADALERAELGIAGFGLELNLGYWPDGTTLRNPLDFSRLLDQWSLRLELPVMLQVTLPSTASPESLPGAKARVVAAGGGDDADFQSRWIERCLPMLLAKNCVQVVLWNAPRDTPHALYPNGGLLDESGAAKPALAALRELRDKYLA
ncbi:MAG: endo-1,4-beta-xylanase [Planctomycetota bacterium]